jgi:DNA-binding CsgD family transcriptional regulator
VSEVAALHLEAAAAWELRPDLEAALTASSRAAELLMGTDHSAASEAAAAAASLCWQLGRGEADEWWTVALEAAAAGGSVALLRARQRWLVSCMRQGRIGEAGEAAALLRSAIAEVELEREPDPSGEISVLLEQAHQRLLVFETLALGQPVEALLADERPVSPNLPLTVRIELEGPQLDALVFLGRFEEARRRSEGLLRELGPLVSVNRLSWRAVAALAAAHLASGAWDDAADALTSFEIDVPNARSAWAFWAGVLALRRGDVAAAREAVAMGRPAAGDSGLVMRQYELDAVAAYADLLAGDAPSVDVGQRADGYFAMSHVLRTTLAGEVLVREGRRVEAVALVGGLRARSGPDTYPHAVAARIEALAEGDAAGLVAAADALDRSQVPFESAVARLEAAELDRALVPARALIRCAELFERLGAVPWAARARALGSETAVGRRTTVPQLTRREREVAELVAEGLTNGQVAERLHVSIRTVTSHLDHAYTKLGIGSRAALVAHLLRLPEPT